jgi:hypothetical protein
VQTRERDLARCTKLNHQCCGTEGSCRARQGTRGGQGGKVGVEGGAADKTALFRAKERRLVVSGSRRPSAAFQSSLGICGVRTPRRSCLWRRGGVSSATCAVQSAGVRPEGTLRQRCEFRLRAAVKRAVADEPSVGSVVRGPLRRTCLRQRLDAQAMRDAFQRPVCAADVPRGQNWQVRHLTKPDFDSATLVARTNLFPPETESTAARLRRKNPLWLPSPTPARVGWSSELKAVPGRPFVRAAILEELWRVERRLPSRSARSEFRGIACGDWRPDSVGSAPSFQAKPENTAPNSPSADGERPMNIPPVL